MTFIFDPSWLQPQLLIAAGASISPDFSIVIQTIFFVATLLVLKNVMFPPVLKVILERKRRMEEAHRELKQLEDEGFTMEQEYEDKIRDARWQAQELHSQARKEAADAEHEVLEAARKESAQKLYENTASLNKQRDEILEQFDQDSEEMAREIASKLLDRTIPSQS